MLAVTKNNVSGFLIRLWQPYIGLPDAACHSNLVLRLVTTSISPSVAVQTLWSCMPSPRLQRVKIRPCMYTGTHTLHVHRHTHLACGLVCGDEDIPRSKVTMDEPFGGQVQHTKGNLSTEAEEGGTKF